MNSQEITLRIVMVPNMPETIHGVSFPDPADPTRFTVRLNGADPEDRRAKALAHEWQHIRNGDHDKPNAADQIEAKPHGK